MAEAVSTAYYFINRSPSAIIRFNTLEELWSGQPTSYKHLRIFGCPTYVHVRQGKLDAKAVKVVFVGYPNAKAVKGVFVGYPEDVKSYKV